MKELLFDKNTLFSLILTLKIILSVIPFLLILSLLFAYFSLKKIFIIDQIIDFIINLPIIFPPIGIGFFLVQVLGKNSFLGKVFNFDIVFSFEGICIAAIISGLPFITRSLIAGIRKNIFKLCEVSYTLGKSKFYTFIHIVIPSLRKNIIYGLILSIGRIIGEVGITLMIGGNISGKTNTISLEIYNSVLDGEENKAIFLSIILFIFSFFLFFILKSLDNE